MLPTYLSTTTKGKRSAGQTSYGPPAPPGYVTYGAGNPSLRGGAPSVGVYAGGGTGATAGGTGSPVQRYLPTAVAGRRVPVVNVPTTPGYSYAGPVYGNSIDPFGSAFGPGGGGVLAGPVYGNSADPQGSAYGPGGSLAGTQPQGAAPATAATAAPVNSAWLQAAIASALKQARVAPGALPGYKGLASQLANDVIVQSPEVMQTVNALLAEQGSAPIAGAYTVGPNQVDSATLYNPDGTYNWVQHNALRAMGLTVI